MHHDMPLVSTLAAALGLAVVLGFVANRVKLPAIVGYLVAGIVLSPSTPGWVGDTEIAAQLAEIGVMLLMFGVGLHFSLEDLTSVRRIAVRGALVQIAVATALTTGTVLLWDWPIGGALVFGLSLSVASTVVLLRALEDRGLLDSLNGRIAVGWLVVEDLAMVLVLVLLPSIGTVVGDSAAPSSAVPWREITITLARVAAFVASMLVVGRRLFPWLLWHVTRTGSRELFNLCVIAAAVTIAWASALVFHVSLALGAFFAGMVMRGSAFSHRAAQESLPLRDAFAVLFFVSVGMLFDPAVLVERPLQVLVVVVIIVLGKSIAAAGVVLALRYPIRTALTVSASLAQIGEFSFILGVLGVELGLLPPEGHSLILAGAIVSISLNPVIFRAVEPTTRWLTRRFPSMRGGDPLEDPLLELPRTTEAKYLSRHVVLIGHGRVGASIAEALERAGIPLVAVDQSREIVEELRARGKAAVWGDASDAGVLVQAHIGNASMLVVATPHTLDVRRIAHIARTVNSTIEILVRTDNEAEAELLDRDGAGEVFLGERELARAMVRRVFQRFGANMSAVA
jgi:CPA2 family monovalent cation:H+ antiporter-2